MLFNRYQSGVATLVTLIGVALSCRAVEASIRINITEVGSQVRFSTTGGFCDISTFGGNYTNGQGGPSASLGQLGYQARTYIQMDGRINSTITATGFDGWTTNAGSIGILSTTGSGGFWHWKTNSGSFTLMYFDENSLSGTTGVDLKFTMSSDWSLTTGINTSYSSLGLTEGSRYKISWDTDFIEFYVGDSEANPVPEPATVVVWSVLGLCGVGYGLRRKKRKTS